MYIGNEATGECKTEKCRLNIIIPRGIVMNAKCNSITKINVETLSSQRMNGS